MKEILLAARAKIQTPDTWTQHALARDLNGYDKPNDHPLANQIHWEGIDGRDPRACKWCAVGALQAVTPDSKVFNEAYYALAKAAKALFGKYNVSEVNDEHGHAAVLQCYDKAIAS